MAPKARGSTNAGSSTEREGAVIATGAEALANFAALLQGFGFGGGMFPLPTVVEFGFVEKTGFFWIQQPKRLEHTFPMAKLLVVYHAEVSGRIQKGKMTTLKGLKIKHEENKDLFLAATASEGLHFAGRALGAYGLRTPELDARCGRPSDDSLSKTVLKYTK